MKSRKKLLAGVLTITLMASLLAVMAVPVTGNEEQIEKITISIRSDELPEKPPWAGGPGGGGGEEKEQGKGYKLMKGGVRIQNTPSTYVINPTNEEEISTDSVEAEVTSAFNEWDDNVPAVDIFVYGETTTRSGANRDSENVISFVLIDGDGGIVAQTTIWYNPATKNVLEYDIVFDSGEEWGVDLDGEGDTTINAFDLRNVATHEAGHALVLEDLYDEKYSEMTMYGYTTMGETKKRSIEWGDSNGIHELYM